MTARPDDWRNFGPILGTYLYIAAVVAGALSFFWSREDWGLSLWWDVPVGLVAVALIGPAQHRLWILLEEAALGTLFRSRWLNELAGDWLLAFPFGTSVHHVRHQLRAHHDFTNDPARDAQLVINREAGFWPPRFGRFLRASALIKWFSLRAYYNFRAGPENPYLDPARPPSKVALRVGTAYVLVMFAFLIAMYFRPGGDDLTRTLLFVVPPALWTAAVLVFLALPASKYHASRLTPVYSARAMTLMRVTFITLLNCGLGWTTFLTGRSAVLNYVALWIGPLVTVTAALTLVRQWRQHGTAGVGGTNEVRPGPFGKLLVFPLGQDRHRERHADPGAAWWGLGDAEVRTRSAD